MGLSFCLISCGSKDEPTGSFSPSFFTRRITPTMPFSSGRSSSRWTLCCAIGDDAVGGRPYAEIVEIARNYVRSVGGFERFAEWGLV